MKESTQHAKRLWSVIGETYMMSGGLVAFTIFVTFAFAQANITFFVPIMLIVSGVLGTIGFIISKPAMFPKIIGTTGSMKNTTGLIIKEVYDMEASVRRIELESCKNEADKFIMVSQTRCSNCSRENPTDAEFCVGCGKVLK